MSTIKVLGTVISLIASNLFIIGIFDNLINLEAADMLLFLSQNCITSFAPEIGTYRTNYKERIMKNWKQAIAKTTIATAILTAALSSMALPAKANCTHSSSRSGNSRTYESRCSYSRSSRSSHRSTSKRSRVQINISPRDLIRDRNHHLSRPKTPHHHRNHHFPHHVPNGHSIFF